MVSRSGFGLVAETCCQVRNRQVGVKAESQPHVVAVSVC